MGTEGKSGMGTVDRRGVLGSLAGAATMVLTGLEVNASATPATAHPQTDPCTGPAPEPEPGTSEWYARDRMNAYCAQQGQQDFTTNPAIETENASTWLNLIQDDSESLDTYHGNPYREPATQWDGERGRYREVAFTNEAGEEIPGAIFLPREDCRADDEDCPKDLPRHDGPPYPGVQIGYHLSSRTGTADLLL